jgi:superfamily I DNA/RNA helicase
LGGTRFFAVDSGVASGGGSLSPSSIAILCRTSKQFPIICKALDDHAIPWQTSKTGNNEKPELVEKIILIFKTLLAPQNNWLVKQFTKMLKKEVPQDFILPQTSVEHTLRAINTAYFNNLKGNDAIQFEGLLELAKAFDEKHEDFIAFLDSDTPETPSLAANEAVHVLSLHASKGLEFEHVYIAGCEDRIIPYSLFKGHESQPDEEKRLLYVGMTRARTQLYLTYAMRRRLFNMNMALERSPFLNQIEKELIQKEKHEIKPRPGNQQLELF